MTRYWQRQPHRSKGLESGQCHINKSANRFTSGGSHESTSYKSAPTKSVSVDGTRNFYRELGIDSGVPVIFLNHLAANLDNWDPRVVDGIAAKHRVITFDNRGVGASEGSTPNSIEVMARDAVAFIRALGFDHSTFSDFPSADSSRK
jgi:hypothetical protein